MQQVNFWVALAAATAGFLLGALWYSPPLFGNVWMKVAGLSEETLKKGNMALIFGLAYGLTLLIALNLAVNLGSGIGLEDGVSRGVRTGLGYVAFSLAILYLFERRSPKHLWINGGYLMLLFALMGGIIGAWQ